MSTTDHYAEAERLASVLTDARAETMTVAELQLTIAAATVHATLATVQRSSCPHDWIAPTKIGDGEGNEWVRVECALCGAVDDRPDSRTIPWPPSDELVEKVAGAIGQYAPQRDPDEHELLTKIARAVLDAIGGDHA